jgi:hypothetical protein
VVDVVVVLVDPPAPVVDVAVVPAVDVAMVPVVEVVFPVEDDPTMVEPPAPVGVGLALLLPHAARAAATEVEAVRKIATVRIEGMVFMGQLASQ